MSFNQDNVNTAGHDNGTPTDAFSGFGTVALLPATKKETAEERPEVTERCTYRNCRHRHDQHGHSFKVDGKTKQCRCKHFTPRKLAGSNFKGKIIDPKDPEFIALCSILDAIDTYCDCGEARSSYDVKQEYFTTVDDKTGVQTFHECPKCHYGLQPWKIGRKITRAQIAEVRSRGIVIPDGWVIE